VTIVVALLRLVVALLLLRLGLRFVAGVIRGLREPAPDQVGGGDMVRDRVCNTFVPRERALTALVGGREMHFCSAACRDRALTLPAGP
jgi:YHS domain-containing protein